MTSDTSPSGSPRRVPEELLAAWRAEQTGQPEGWNFSSLTGRMDQDSPPWDFEQVCREAAGQASHVLDMGTGDGEALLRLADVLPHDTVATEGWAPNVPVATAALAAHGIAVVEFGQPDDLDELEPMPFPTGRFDLILNRHESYHPGEIARVLAPGGTFLTQQVGGDELGELLGHPAPAPQVRFDLHRAALSAAGLSVVDGAQFVGSYRFDDVAALVAYLQLVPWEAPEDFTVDAYAEQLLALHESGPASGPPVRLSLKRFWLRCRRPA
ncbi:MAG: class I SAM-dependent methyltransferase [Ornithinimicrobium sp.]|uniref:class I SAM-dependent methyltransferase n=1 Tax=Ornithinimicrobium sp. TaxID=1977084 RepID=UPI003D9ACBF2